MDTSLLHVEFYSINIKDKIIGQMSKISNINFRETSITDFDDHLTISNSNSKSQSPLPTNIQQKNKKNDIEVDNRILLHIFDECMFCCRV